jgi:hypothetical protein
MASAVNDQHLLSFLWSCSCVLLYIRSFVFMKFRLLLARSELMIFLRRRLLQSNPTVSWIGDDWKSRFWTWVLAVKYLVSDDRDVFVFLVSLLCALVGCCISAWSMKLWVFFFDNWHIHRFNSILHVESYRSPRKWKKVPYGRGTDQAAYELQHY